MIGLHSNLFLKLFGIHVMMLNITASCNSRHFCYTVVIVHILSYGHVVYKITYEMSLMNILLLIITAQSKWKIEYLAV